MKASFTAGLLALASVVACADPPHPAPPSTPAPTPTPPALFDALPLGAALPTGNSEIKSTLEGAPATLLLEVACKEKVAGVSTVVTFPAGSEDGITAAVAYGQRLEARFVRDGFTDASGGGSSLKDDLFRGKAEGNYESSFGWDETIRKLAVRCVGDKCEVRVAEEQKRCPNGGDLRRLAPIAG